MAKLGPVSNPAVRRRRAQIARAAQSTLDYHIRKLVDAAPPLTPEQRDRLAVLLRPTEQFTEPVEAETEAQTGSAHDDDSDGGEAA